MDNMWIVWVIVGLAVIITIGLFIKPYMNGFLKKFQNAFKENGVEELDTRRYRKGNPPEGAEKSDSEPGKSAIGAHIARALQSGKVKGFLILSVLIYIAIGVFSLKSGIEVIKNYLIMLIPTLIIDVLIIFYGCSQKANKLCIFGLILLNSCAALARASFATTGSVMLHMLLGVMFVLIGALLHRLLSKNSHWQWILAFFAALFTLLLCLAMPEKNGARGWLYIGGKQILQLTEFAKFFYVFFIGILFSNKYAVWLKFVISAVGTAVFCAILLVCNELGTILVMCTAYIFTVFLTLNNLSGKEKGKKHAEWAKGILLVGIAAVLAIGIVGYNKIDKNVGLWKCPAEKCGVKNASDAKICAKCEAEKPVEVAFFKCSFCKYTTWEEIELVKNEDGVVLKKSSCPHCKNVKLLSGDMGITFKKLYDRLAIAYNFEEVKDSDIAYQAKQCHSAMKVGGLFGDTETIVDIPRYTVDTDSVVASLSNRLGLIYVMIVLIAFSLIFISLWNASSPLRVMALCAFVFQALITYLGTMNLIPATGIGVPLVSRGGSNLVISYLLIYLILTSVKLARGGKKHEKK